MASFLSRTYLAVYGYTTGGESISSFGTGIEQGSGLAFKEFNKFEAQQQSQGYRGDPSFQGSVEFQSGFLYNPDCITFESTLDDLDKPYAGNMQPDAASLEANFRQDFTNAGQCTATTVEGDTILSHSCLFNLCLGEGNCLTYYAGGPYLFDHGDSTGAEFTEISEFKVAIDEDSVLSPYEKTLFGGTGVLPIPPPLAPAYAGTILGGIGIFNDNRNPIEGSVDVVTIAGRRRPRGIGDVNGNPGIVDIVEADRGALVQQIFINSNQELVDFPLACAT